MPTALSAQALEILAVAANAPPGAGKGSIQVVPNSMGPTLMLGHGERLIELFDKQNEELYRDALNELLRAGLIRQDDQHNYTVTTAGYARATAGPD
jgi:hypothetical protein